MKIGIAADHGGFEMKKNIEKFLAELRCEVEDFGAYDLDNEDDYPDFVIPLAVALSEGKIEKGLPFAEVG